LGRSGSGGEKNGCGEEEPCGFDADGHSVSLAALEGEVRISSRLRGRR
jgi:hypothetical protein